MQTLKTFERTLILGASVSVAPVEKNPTKQFLKDIGALQGYRMHASGGTPGARVLSTLRKSLLDEVTAVVAIDLLFWDSVVGLAEPEQSRAFLRGFFGELKRRELPLIIGRIPEFHFMQIHREELNQAIEKECRGYERARILALDQLMADAVVNSGVEIDGKLHSLESLIPDGLHPGELAARYIAKEIGKVALELKVRRPEAREA